VWQRHTLTEALAKEFSRGIVEQRSRGLYRLAVFHFLSQTLTNAKRFANAKFDPSLTKGLPTSVLGGPALDIQQLGVALNGGGTPPRPAGSDD